MNSQLRNTILTITSLFVIATHTRAEPIGIFDRSIHDRIEIRFQFDPIAAGPPYALALGLGGSLVPPSSGLAGCNCELLDEGGIISSRSIDTFLGCQGVWVSDEGTGYTDIIDMNVDLSGIAAGEVGTMVLRPRFLGPEGIFSASSPSIIFVGGGSVSILSQKIYPHPIPEPASFSLLAVGGVGIVLRWISSSVRASRSGGGH